MRKRPRFLLSSEQCELLLNFEESASLAELAKLVLRDVSVLSRGMRELAVQGVVEKNENRWVLTARGRVLNNATRVAIEAQERVLRGSLGASAVPNELPTVDTCTALVIIGAQQGFDHPQWGLRNNVAAEDHIASILAQWRLQKGLVVHVRHRSAEPHSPLREGTHGYAFKAFVIPAQGELEILKASNCAFIGTTLERDLRARGISKIVVVGFSANHCIDASAKAASDLGFLVTVISDACVAFDSVSPDGELLRAELVHRVVMANLSQESATVVSARTLLEAIAGSNKASALSV